MTYIGSGPKNDIILTGKHVSDQHACLIRNNGVMIIEDLNSTFGTFVNGKRITKPTTLRTTDRVKIGTQLFHWKDHLTQNIDKDEKGIYLKDLFYPTGKISWDTYKYVLLISLAMVIIVPLGVPRLLALVEYSPKTGRGFDLLQFSNTITWIIGAVAFYIFVNLTVKAIRNKIS
ncbi:MAG: FHA domain-containing protein [Bacteroidota bacterium]